VGCCYVGDAGGGVAETRELVERIQILLCCNDTCFAQIVMTELSNRKLRLSRALLANQGIPYCNPPLLTSLITIVALLALFSAAS